MAKKENYKVLLPTDGSIPALAATKHAIELVKRMEGKLTILMVKESSPITPIERLAEDTILMRTTRVDGVEYAKRLAEKEGVSYDLQIREGPVAAKIINAAEELNVDLIVMGSSNPKGLSGFFLGHVADAVIKSTPISVTVIKPNARDIAMIIESTRTLSPPKVELMVQKPPDMKKFRVGLVLFSVYTLWYIVYTVLGSFFKTTFQIELLGMNFGIVGGMSLIISAIVIAIFYNVYASKRDKNLEVA